MSVKGRNITERKRERGEMRDEKEVLMEERYIWREMCEMTKERGVIE